MERLACIRRDSLDWLAGTAWHSLEVVDKLEQRTGKPVVTSN
jgi:maleate cis-trans isomerase